MSIYGYGQTASNKRLVDSISYLLQAKEIPGAFVTVVTKDSVLFQEVFGIADIKANISVEEKHLFRIASITKTFTAMAIMKLVDDGRLSLDDELRKIAPEIPFTNKWEKTYPVRIKHLLEHKAGFEDMRFSTMVKRTQDAATNNALEAVLRYENSFSCAWKPGLVTSYSNPGYIILGYIIEKISGQKNQDFIRSTILNPLHMVHTGFASEMGKRNDVVTTGYMSTDGRLRVAEQRQPKVLETATGLLSTSEDMGKFLQFFLNENLQDSLAVISKKGVSEMETLHGDFELANNILTGYSLGLEDRVFGDADLLFKGNSGLTDGFVTNLIYSRKLNLGIAVSSNLFGVGHRDIINLIVDAYADSDSTNPAVFTTKTFDEELFKDWVGEHRELNDTQEIFNFINFPLRTKTVSFENDRLIISDIENDYESYVHVGGNAFMDISNAETVPSVYLTEFEGDKSLYYYDSTYVSANGIAYAILRFLLILSLVAPILATIWLLVLAIKLILKKGEKGHILKLFLFVAPFWIVLLSVALFFSHLSYDKIEAIGNFSFVSILIFLCSLLFPVSCFYGVYIYYRDRPLIKQKFTRLFFGVLAFCNLFLGSYCIYMGWFALRLWSY